MARFFRRAASSVAKLRELIDIEPHRILLVKPSAFGDVVQTLPILSGLRDRFPDAHIGWLVQRSFTGLLDGHPDLNEILPFDRAGSIGRSLQLARLIRNFRADLVCDLQGLLRSGLMTGVSGARWRIGLATAHEGAGWFYSHVVPVPDPNAPAVSRYWQLANVLGFGHLDRRSTVPIGDVDVSWARAAVQGQSERPGDFSAIPTAWRYAVCPGARWPTKRWTPSFFVDVIEKLYAELGATAVIVGGNDDVELARTIERRLTAPAVNLVGRTTLKQLAATLRICRFTLTNDTGPMHLSAAVGTPVVGLFLCTSPVRAGANGTGHVNVQTRVACAGRYRRECSRMDCLRELTPHRVYGAIQAVLNSTAVSQSA